MLPVYDYDHPSDYNVPTPRGRTIAHANVCMITNDSNDDDIITHKPVDLGVNFDTSDTSNMYQSCVDALINDDIVFSADSSTDHLPVHGTTTTSTASSSNKSATQSTPTSFIGVYRTSSKFQFIPRVGRYAHQTNRIFGNTHENNVRRIRENANDLKLRDWTRGTDHSKLIARIRERAMRLHQLPVTRPILTQSTRALDTTVLNSSPAQCCRQHSLPHAPVLLTDVASFVNSGDETHAVSRMLIDLTVDAPPPLINAHG